MEPQALYTGRAILSVELHPFYSNSALEGVTEDLNARVLRCLLFYTVLEYVGLCWSQLVLASR